MGKLTNRDIAEKYSNSSFYFMPSDFKGAFAYWVAALNENDTFVVDKALKAFWEYIKPVFKDEEIPVKLTYQELNELIDEKKLAEIPEILALNYLKPEFISLGALERNVFFMLCREEITQPL